MTKRPCHCVTRSNTRVALPSATRGVIRRGQILRGGHTWPHLKKLEQRIATLEAEVKSIKESPFHQVAQHPVEAIRDLWKRVGGPRQEGPSAQPEDEKHRETTEPTKSD